MNVELVSATQPAKRLQERGILTPEDIIVYEARVSSPQNQETMGTATRLLKYCLREKHWSVFQMADMTLEIETSIAIANQVLRHWSLVMTDHCLDVQQFSQRYAKADMGFETYKARRQDEKNRQNSIDDLPADVQSWWDDEVRIAHENAQESYETALRLGIAKEQARFLLPMSTTTRFYLKGSCRSWIHYLQSRTADGVQQEHKDLAVGCRTVFADVFPAVHEAVFGDSL